MNDKDLRQVRGDLNQALYLLAKERSKVHSIRVSLVAEDIEKIFANDREVYCETSSGISVEMTDHVMVKLLEAMVERSNPDSIRKLKRALKKKK